MKIIWIKLKNKWFNKKCPQETSNLSMKLIYFTITKIGTLRKNSLGLLMEILNKLLMLLEEKRKQWIE